MECEAAVVCDGVVLFTLPTQTPQEIPYWSAGASSLV
jgi:hypothetical protein